MAHAREISRRNVTKGLAGLFLLAASGGTTAVVDKFLIEQFTEKPEFIAKLQKLQTYNRIFFNPTNERLIGPAVNIPFAAYSHNPNVPYNVAKQMNDLDSRLARVYIPQQFEKSIGNYDRSYLSKMQKFILEVTEHSKKINPNSTIGFDLVLDDAFDLLYSDKPAVYGSRPLSHYALKGASDPRDIAKYQREFFTSKEMSDAFIRRSRYILRHLYPVKNHIAAIEIMNEPDINIQKKEKIDTLTDWYSRVVPHIRDFYPDTPTISGVKNPYLIHSAALRKYGLDNNSAHPYGSTTFEQESVIEYVHEMPNNPDLAPLLILESGVAGKVGILNLPKELHDWYMAKSYSNLVINSCSIDHATSQVIFPIGCFGAWKLDTGPESHDWFQFNSDNYPFMREVMQTVGSLLALN